MALAALAANYRILWHFFLADDFANMFELANSGLKDFAISPASGHMYLIRNAVFYLMFALFRMNSTGYYAVALATHVVNALLLLALIRRVTTRPLAWFGATLFAVAPTNVGTLGWYSVYGHALATTFTLAAVLFLVPDRDANRPPTPAGALAATGCVVAASQCFGTGAVVGVLLPLLALLLRPAVRRSPAALASLCVASLSIAIAWWLIYARTPESEGQRTMLIALAPFYGKVAAMLVHMVSIGVVSLLLGAWYPLTRYPDATSAAVTAAFGLALILTFGMGSSSIRRNLAAFLLVTLVCYGAIAAGRATLLFAFRPKDVTQAFAASTRYHYLAQAALTVVLCVMLQEAIRRGQEMALGAHRVRALIAGWGIAAVVGSVLLRPPSDDYRGQREQIEGIRKAIAAEVAQYPPGSVVCVPNRPAALAFGFPGWVGVFMLYNPGEESDQRRVYFTTSDRATLALLDREGARIRRLLLPEGACPPRPGIRDPWDGARGRGSGRWRPRSSAGLIGARLVRDCDWPICGSATMTPTLSFAVLRLSKNRAEPDPLATVDGDVERLIEA